MNSRQDFLDWKAHPVTKLVFEHLRQREGDIKEVLATEAGFDSTVDRYHTGYIAAIRDVVLMDFEEAPE